MTERRRSATRAVTDQVRELSLETQHYIDAVARGLGHHRTDIEAIGALLDAARTGETLTPGELGRRVNLSAAAVTALLDRLERSGHIRRHPHAQDGRMMLVDPTAQARDTSQAMFAPLIREQEATLAGYSDAELALIERVLIDLAAATRRSHREELPD